MTAIAPRPPFHRRMPLSAYPTYSSVPDGPRSRVLVTGSRDVVNEPLVRCELTRAWREAGQPLVVVHGACPTGVDAIAATWCREHEFAGIVEERHPARWHLHGRAAGPVRNAEMVQAGAWRVLAFPAGLSRGTRHCMRTALAAGLDVRVFEAAPAPPAPIERRTSA